LIGQGMALVALVKDKLDEVLGRNDADPGDPDRDSDDSDGG